MPTYEIPAPNGQRYRIDGPPGASQADIQAQVLAQHPDAGTPRPAAGNYDQRWKDVSQEKAMQIYQMGQQSVLKNAGARSPEAQAKLLRRFDADPRVATIRARAGLAPVQSKQESVRAIARANVEANPGLLDKPNQAISASGQRAAFGIPEHIDAALRYKLGVGGPAAGSYGDTLDLVREENNVRMEGGNWGANALGMLVGGGGAGLGAGKLVAAGTGKVAAAGVPFLSKGANYLQRLYTLKEGEKLKNAAKLAVALPATGAAYGAAQSAGEGSDVGTGALVGAAAGTALPLGAKLVGAGAMGAFNFARRAVGKEPIENILASFIKGNSAELQANLDRARQTGRDPTLYEIMPLGDRQRLKKMVGRMPDKQREQVQQLIQTRASTLVDETGKITQNIIRPYGPDQRTAVLATDLANSRRTPGGPPVTVTSGEMAAAEHATRSTTGMKDFRTEEAKRIMAPFDNRVAYQHPDQLIPQQGGFIPAGEEDVARVIRSVTGLKRGTNSEVTIRDLTDMISALRGDVATGGVDGRVAQRAINHLENILQRDHLDVMPAYTRMRDAFAARARMQEGMVEGAKTRTQRTVQEPTQKTTNAYETREGNVGRAFGQANQLETDFGNTPEGVFSKLDQIAGSPGTQQAISGNLGNNAGQQIADLAEAQSRSARNLSGLFPEQEAVPGEVQPVQILQNVMRFGPGTLPATKIFGVGQALGWLTGLPEKQSSQIAEMLFSQNPTQISRALNMLTRMGAKGQKAIGALPGIIAQMTAPGQDDTVPTTAPDPAPPVEQAPTEEAPPAGPSQDPQYAAALEQIHSTQDPAFLDLVERVAQHESAGQQHDKNGQPLTSSAGAIGIMQMKPDTAKHAAGLAGVPWDENAFHHDANYNKLLGTAYIGSLLTKYDGDVMKALGAYGAGEEALDKAVSKLGDNWITGLPQETQQALADYSQ